ncbi:MAG: OmpH family outer membrane protein [Flavobacteriales bacterium]|nr:OmpH family outer membrane protein [Flavobacteriales bacterium]MCB9198455.1 OmpH family outer membrane protein [Flavobacteriales bacterium]
MKLQNLKLGKGVLVIVVLVVLIAAKTTGTKSKVGYINTNELWSVMPEKQAADLELKKMEEQMIAYYQQEQKTFEAGINAYVRDSSAMTELVKKQTIQKLQQQQDNIQSLPQAANEELAKKQEALYAPIREKMQKAIDEVAKENGYDYILDAAYGNIVYAGNEGDNVISLVKVKLGLK